MRRIPQIRLRTLFLMFACVAIGLTIGTQPAESEDRTFGIPVMNLNWEYALMSAASVALIAGLAQQAFELRRLAEREPFSESPAFAIRYAVLGGSH